MKLHTCLLPLALVACSSQTPTSSPNDFALETTHTITQALEAPHPFAAPPNTTVLLHGMTTSSYFCYTESQSFPAPQTGSKHQLLVVNDPTNGNAPTYEITSGPGSSFGVLCERCTNFAGVSSCSSIGSSSQFICNNTTSNGLDLDGSHIWVEGSYQIVTGSNPGPYSLNLAGLTPPLQEFAVSAGPDTCVSGNSRGVAFLNSSGQAIVPALNVTLYNPSVASGDQRDLGPTTNGPCWLADDVTALDIYIDLQNPPHHWLDARATQPGTEYTAWCLGYWF